MYELARYTALNEMPAGRSGPEPAPLPPSWQDQSVVDGNILRQTFADAVQAVEVDFSLTDIQKAVKLRKLWTTAEETRIGLYRDLQQRRLVRLNWLFNGFPWGPHIDPDETPADRAILLQAFNAALAEARAADPGALNRMLQDATRFGDEMRGRAVLTVINEQSAVDLLDPWAAIESPELLAELQEWRDLNNVVEGRDPYNFAVVQALGPISEPDESAGLDDLVKAHNASAQMYNSSGARGTGQFGRQAPARPIIDLDQLLAGAS